MLRRPSAALITENHITISFVLITEMANVKLNKVKRQLSFRNLRRRITCGRSASDSMASMMDGEADEDHLLENCEPLGSFINHVDNVFFFILDPILIQFFGIFWNNLEYFGIIWNNLE